MHAYHQQGLTRSADIDGRQKEEIVLLVLGSDLGGATILGLHEQDLLVVTVEAADALRGIDVVLAEGVDQRGRAIGLVARVAEDVDASGRHVEMGPVLCSDVGAV